ncbi:MAG: hypothetical protein JWQ22_837 [Devosia sp.]|nr:hypothetical protein [Devosia sp.]
MSPHLPKTSGPTNADKGVLLIIALVCVPVAICAGWLALLS